MRAEYADLGPTTVDTTGEYDGFEIQFDWIDRKIHLLGYNADKEEWFELSTLEQNGNDHTTLARLTEPGKPERVIEPEGSYRPRPGVNSVFIVP